MTHRTLSLAAAAVTAAATVFAGQARAATPAPDPAPGAGQGKIINVAYTVDAPAYALGRRIPGFWVHCRVPTVWHGHRNVAGHRVCVLFPHR